MFTINSRQAFQVIVAIVMSQVLLLAHPAPAAAQGCTDPASGRTIPCPPKRQGDNPQAEQGERQGQDNTENNPGRSINPPKVVELCTAKPTIDYFKASKVDVPQQGTGLVFEWNTRNAKSVSLDFVDAAEIQAVYALELNGKFGALLSKLAGMKSATLSAVCPPFETIATLSSDLEWFSSSAANSNPVASTKGAQLDPPVPNPVPYSGDAPDAVKAMLLGLLCLGMSLAFMTVGGLGGLKALIDLPEWKWLKDLLDQMGLHLGE